MVISYALDVIRLRCTLDGSYLDRAVTRDAHGIMFHHFHGNGHPVVQGSISGEELADMVEFIGGQRKILPADRWMEKAIQGTLKQDDFCLTFDDGLRGQKDIAVPVLEKLGLTAMFFVYSSVFLGELEYLEIFRAFRTSCFENIDDFYEKFFKAAHESKYESIVRAGLSGYDPENYLAKWQFYTEADRRFRYLRDRILGTEAYNELMIDLIGKTISIEELSSSLWMNNEDLVNLTKAGHVLGLHSYSHPTTMNEMSYQRQKKEYQQNIDHLTSLLDAPPRIVSHPCNAYSSATLEILEDLGVKIGFRDNMLGIGGGGLEFPREDHANILAMMEGRR